MPYDSIDFAATLDALMSCGFVARYGDHGEYGWIPSFLSHQCINQRESQSKIPKAEDFSDGNSPDKHMQAHACTYEYSGVNIQPKLRDFILTRDGGACKRCGSSCDLTVDHIFPQSIGGTHAKTNLRTLCRQCNSARPVQGAALVADLAKDGFNMDDMERICTHVQEHGERKGKEGKGKEGNMEGKGNEPPPLKSDGEDEVFQFWNSFSHLPKILRISKERRAKIKTRLSDPFFRDNWRIGIEKIEAAPFLTGNNDRGWRADIDWFLKPDSLTKIIEGKYHQTNAPRKPTLADLMGGRELTITYAADQPQCDDSDYPDEDEPPF